MGDECCNGTQVESVLSAQPRRVLRALLEDDSRPADPILRDGETLDSEDHLTVCYELHHLLLPALANERLVEFDMSEDEVRRGTGFEEVRQYLEQIDDEIEA